MPNAENEFRPVPGMWWSTFAHAQAGRRFFITKNEPVLQLYEGGVFFLVADENFIVTNAEGFQLFWKYYCPAEGETVEPIDPEEIKRVRAITSGEPVVEGHSDSESGDALATEPPTVGGD